ncbi:MAG: ATP-binding cassette domain-containing protein, partial [Chloroflexota bacterium]|nr:ATP-binding cassette domain-containing protein [Chloroflexota bacterium]
MALLEIQNLHAYYGHVHALKGISLNIEEGEIVTLIGANGAGKTTTLRSISGLLRPSEGRIVFGDHTLNDVPAHQIVYRGICQAPEGRKIFSTLTVQENLNMGAYSLGGDKAAIEANRRRVFALFPRLEE